MKKMNRNYYETYGNGQMFFLFLVINELFIDIINYYTAEYELCCNNDNYKLNYVILTYNIVILVK